MIGIIGAMKEEVDAIKEYMSVTHKSTHLNYDFYQGIMNGKEVVLMQSGIGKVNAAISTTLLFHYFDIDYVINVGSAGGLDVKQNVGDVVISSQVVHHDVDITAFGREMGEIPDMPRYFVADSKLLKEVQNILENENMPYHIGLIASGDQFVCREDQVAKIKKDFPEVMCAEMEAASIAQVCYVYKKKFIITRSLSDVFNKGENHIQFDEYLKEASQKSAKMCSQLVSCL